MLSITSVALLVTVAQCVVVKNGVVFEKVNLFYNSWGHWWVTSFVDFGRFETFVNKFSGDIERAFFACSKIAEKYDDPKVQHLKTYFDRIQNQFQNIKDTKSAIEHALMGYGMLTKRTRKRRSLLPFVGQISNWLFGTVTEDSLDEIRKNVETLARNQAKMVINAKKRVAVMSATRMEVESNRDSINHIVDAVRIVDAELKNVTRTLEMKIQSLSIFTQAFIHLELVLNYLEQAADKAISYLSHLENQIGILSLGQITPAVIHPASLKEILIGIKDSLPSHLKLPYDPSTGLFKYYKTLTCTTTLENNRILITFRISLIDMYARMELFKIHSLPIPFPNSNRSHVLAKYSIEEAAIAINPERTTYALLDYDDMKACEQFDFCEIRKALRPVNLNRDCVIALFMSFEKDIRENCRIYVRTNQPLPQAIYLKSGYYAVVSNEVTRFSLLCNHSRASTETLTAKVGIDVVHVKFGCQASHPRMLLQGTFHRESRFENIDSFSKILKLKEESIGMWTPYIESFPKHSDVIIPPKLGPIEKFPMENLISDLNDLERISPWEPRENFWITIAIGIVILIVLIIILFRKRKHIFAMLCSRGSDKKTNSHATTFLPVATAPPEESQKPLVAEPDRLDDKKQAEIIELRRLYPMLDNLNGKKSTFKSRKQIKKCTY